MKKILILFLLLVNFLNANNESKKVYSKNLYLSYINYPKHIYKNQRFEIEVKALITRKDFDYIQTRFLNGINMIPLNPESSWNSSGKNNSIFTNKFYFKAYEKKFKMPTIEVTLYKGDTVLERRRISGLDVSFSEIAKSDERFSNIIAKNLKVTASKTKQYTNKEALTIIEIDANKSNLEDFYLKDIEEQGITVIEDNYPDQKIIYYLVIPIHKKTLVFTYYNIKDSQFKKIVVPIVFEEELVSTQTDLNPNNSSFELYKKIAMAVLTLIALALFIWKRKALFLVIFLILAIILILFILPNKTIKLKAQTVIYILPTKNSTIFQKIEKEIFVEDVKRKNGFVKIMFGSAGENYIGWVKEEDVIKN